MTAVNPDAPLDIDLEIEGTLERCRHWRTVKATAIAFDRGTVLPRATHATEMIAFYQDQLGKLMRERARLMQAEGAE